MQEIIKIVSEKTGMSESQSKVAVETVMTYLKNKLPAGMAGQLDSVLDDNGKGSDAGLGGLAGKVGGMFGKK